MIARLPGRPAPTAGLILLAAALALGGGSCDRPDPAAQSPAERALYDKLVQVKWGRTMFDAGHTGTHFAGWSRTFVRNYVAHLIVDEPPVEELP